MKDKEKEEYILSLLNKIDYDIDKLIEKLYNFKLLKLSEIKFIIKKSKEIISQENNIIEVQSPITICGGINGQFHDLLEIFNIGGKPPHTNYIFLGNFIHSGYYNLETLSLLLCLKVRYPKRIFLIRGSQESKETSYIYGLYDECIRKYGSPEIFNNFAELFNFLPLTVLVENKIFGLNGGLSPLLNTLDDIRAINRVKEDPSREVLFYLFWNEPIDNGEGFIPYSKGQGYFFGDNISKKFCNINGLDFIIRDAKPIKCGYFWRHENKVCSICSSPNYNYFGGNEGAFMEIDENMEYNLIKFDSAPRRGKMELMVKTPDYLLIKY